MTAEGNISLERMVWLLIILKIRTMYHLLKRKKRYGLKYHHISRRIKSMNKRMQKEIGERVANKVGRNWALSSIILRNYGAKTDEVENKM